MILSFLYDKYSQRFIINKYSFIYLKKDNQIGEVLNRSNDKIHALDSRCLLL